MYKFKMNLLYNEENFFCTETDLLNFKITLPLAKLDMVNSRLVSNCLVFPVDIPVDILLVSVLLLSNIREVSNEAKNIKF